MQGNVPSQVVEGVQWQWPVHAIAVIVGFSVGMLVLFNIAQNDIPIWVTGPAYAIPLAGAVLLAFSVGRSPLHTPGDKRALAKFFLASYLIAIGAFILSMARSDYAYARDLSWGIAQGYVFIWLPVAVLLPALAAGLYAVSGVSPWRRPVPYAALLLAALLVLVALMPVPNSLTGEDVGADMLGTELNEDVDVLLVFPLWQYLLQTTSIGFIGIVIQMWAGIAMLGLGGMWSLVRPESFRRAFAMHVVPTLAAPLPPEDGPRLRLYG